MDAEENATDEDLLRRYALGDIRAARALSSRHLPRVYGHALRLLGNSSDAEDVSQEAMIRLWRIAPEWQQGQAKLATWLYRVTANLCVDALRKRRGVALGDVDEPVDEGPGVVNQMQQKSRLDALQAGLDRLPLRQRQAVMLRHIDGLPNTEIAQIMDIGIRAVESLTARGKKALAEILETRRQELGFEDDTG